jgi:hypothetical protein
MQMTTTRPSQGLVSSGLVALGLLTRSLQARLALSGPAIAGSIQAFPKDLYCLAHHQIPFANSTRLIMEMVLQLDRLSRWRGDHFGFRKG